MARIAGVDLPNKRLEIALTYIYGIGRTTSNVIIEKAGLDKNMRAGMLTDQDVAALRSVIDEGYRVEGDLRQEVIMNVKRLMDLGSYRGLRHRKGLPVRGQRTSTNARTRKGPKRTMARKKK